MIRIYSRSPLLPLLALSLGFATTACGGSTKSGDQGLTSDGGTEGSVDDEGGPGDAGGSEGAAPEGGSSGVVAVPLYSCLSAEYTAETTIGGQQFQLTVDTGSTTLAVASTTCGSSCVGASPLYTPGSTATDEKQIVNSQYGSGSWDGEVYLDGVAMGTETQFPLKFASITSQKGFFTGGITCTSKAGNVDGIVGFGPAGAAVPPTTGYFDGLVAAQHVPNIFAVELCDSSGTLWLGGYDPTVTTAAPQYTPFMTNEIQGTPVSSIYYVVNLQTVTVNGTVVAIPSGQEVDSVVDTGTSAFLVSTAAFNSIATAIDSTSAFQDTFGSTAASFLAGENCAEVQKTKAELDSALPALTLTFGSNPGITLTATATESYLAPQGPAWCPGMAGYDIGAPIASIMGEPILRNAVVIFDRANKRIGFAPHAACN